MKQTIKPIKLAHAGILASILLCAVGCNSTRFQEQSTRTTVEISHANYKVVKMAAEGTSYGFRLLGIIPFASPSHAAARSKMYASLGQNLNGRSVQTINQLEDTGTIYLVLFSIPRLTMTGDIVEFDQDSDVKRTAQVEKK